EWKVVQPYALVEVEVNSKLGSPAVPSFVASDIKVLDGTDEFPLKTHEVVETLKKRYAGDLKENEKKIDDALAVARKKAKAAGQERKSEIMYLTWLSASERLAAHFLTRVTVRPDAKGDDKNAAALVVEFGMAYEVNKKGEVVRIRQRPVEVVRQEMKM